jgi:hypothetical protein
LTMSRATQCRSTMVWWCDRPRPRFPNPSSKSCRRPRTRAA